MSRPRTLDWGEVERRLRDGHSQPEIARALGTSQQNVSRIARQLVVVDGSVHNKVTRNSDGASPERWEVSPAEIRAWRERCGLTAKQAAERLGVSLRAWQRWEYPEGHASHREPPPYLIRALRDLERELAVRR